MLSTIVLDNLRHEFPDAKIDYLVEIPSRDGLVGLDSVNEVLIFDRKDLRRKVELILKIRKTKYDLIFDFFANPSTALVTFLSGARYRVGFPYRGRRYAYNLFGPAERGKFHSAQLHLETLNMSGLTSSLNKLKFYISPAAKSFADRYFNDNFSDDDFVVGICPSGGWASKRCDPEKFAEIARELINRFRVKILILWGRSDEEDAKEIDRLLHNESYLAPDTSLQELAALISKVKVIIANDSGPMHISTAIGTPVLSLHGPTSPYMQGPFGEGHEWIRLNGLDCIECNLLVCPRNHECFRDLPVERVIEKFEILLSKNNLRRNT